MIAKTFKRMSHAFGAEQHDDTSGNTVRRPGMSLIKDVGH